MEAPELYTPAQPVGAAPVKDWLPILLLLVIWAAGLSLRLVGLDWDEDHHLHPDERFLTMVSMDISADQPAGQFFNTSQSTLNPNNRGYPFYVYGTLPLFVVRLAAERIGMTGYNDIHLVGRLFSAVMDSATIFLVFLIAFRLYRNWVQSLLAGALAAFSVLPIQLSHYYTVDTFTNFFGMLAWYFAVCLLPLDTDRDWAAPPRGGAFRSLLVEWRGVGIYLLFGAALGLAAASKINAALLAVLLPGAVFLRWLHQPEETRWQWVGIYLRNLVLAGFVSLVVFRICQPYAFTGPGFFDVSINQTWLQTLRSLTAQSRGDVDFPPALSWARRPITYAWTNMVLWGMGIPFGLLAWAGFFWMGWRIFKGEWRANLLIWGWTGAYFAYQAFSWVRAMRYQMLVYPTFAIIAAWACVRLWQAALGRSRPRFFNLLGRTVVAIVLIGTAAWAFAFTRIYTRPVTRVAASDWIYQNVPGPFQLRVDTGGSLHHQPVAFRSGYGLQPGTNLVLAFRAQQEGELSGMTFERVLNTAASPLLQVLDVTVRETPEGPPLTEALVTDTFSRENENDGFDRGKTHLAVFDRTLRLDPAQTYYLVFELRGDQPLLFSGGWSLTYFASGGFDHQPLPGPVGALRMGDRYDIAFDAVEGGALRDVALWRVVDWSATTGEKTLRLSIVRSVGPDDVLGQAEVRGVFAAGKDPRGEQAVFTFPQPLALNQGERYILRLEMIDGPGQIAVYGAKPANESSWDDALPVYRDGYNPYDYHYGIYRSDLNFEMYWDDDQAKRERFLSILDQADIIFISSNRQWGTTTRLPERYPLTTAYYRALLGCPPEADVVWCYRVAETGMFEGSLGFSLEAVFQSDPNLGPLRFNTQFAEEAFTVYDHPKVLIFRKTEDYDPQRVRDLLNAVDLTTVVRLTPRQAGSQPGNLLLPADRLAEQQAGGTWSELFDTSALYNRFPWLAAVLWYVVLSLLGWIVYPVTRLALHGLNDRGFPFVRLVGLLLLAYPVWLLGSARVPVTKLLITAVFLVLLVVNGVLAYRQRVTLCAELHDRWRDFVRVEVLALVFFLLFLLVRWGNPDLWHPYKGGEKPMDFSYFNAVVKSTTYPPYDPWFAGGYVNYYYYGFILAGVPVKWLGIVPSIAYNLILPSWFSMLAAGAFSIGWNLVAAARRRLPGQPSFGQRLPFAAPLGGIGAAVGLVILGNWGTVRMFWHGFQRLANMQISFESANMLTRIGWAYQGILRLLTDPGARLPYGSGDWYWIPSRAIPGEPITEFPAFTFLYADLHAHLLALPLTLLALAWALSVLFGRWGWKGWGHLIGSFFVGGLAIAMLRPTNTWDFPAFLGIGLLSVVYTALRYGQVCCFPWHRSIAPRWRRLVIAAFGALLLAAFSFFLYAPYSAWYGQAYTNIDLWAGDHTPFWSYMTHWGVFLFVIVSWMLWETVRWFGQEKETVPAAVRRWLFFPVLLILTLVIVPLLARGIEVAVLALPLMVWAGLLLLRPSQTDGKRAVLIMIGAGLFLTVFVELAVLRGDIGRMNTVFKFYLQAWTFLAISAAAALIWLAEEALPTWREGGKTVWQMVLIVLISGAALFPLLAGMDKINDRMVPNAPKTLDGMAYMAFASYLEGATSMDLSQDYRAIRWMQENVEGSPVIVEANVPEYRWGTRFTIYTGLPGVVGWNWHQRQQRALTDPFWVVDRINEIAAFYATDNQESALAFLRRYTVRYIVVGPLERAVYSEFGFAKFDAWNGELWQEVYRDGETVIYEVLP